MSEHDKLLAALRAIARPEVIPEVARFFWDDSKDNRILGVSFGKVFAVAKQFASMPLSEVELLLESPYFEVRMAAVSIMDFQARAKRTSPEHRQALYDLYLRRHDRIDNWDLVDRAAPYVIGGYLADKPRTVLDKLAHSANPWERRTAMVSTYYFIRQGDLDDTFRIGELLAQDPHELVQKAVGSWLREAGKKDPDRLISFLEAHAATMPRAALRAAIEKLPPAVRERFLSAGAGAVR
jgi:3-methyladenine DNA glycosylase AlkD